MEGKLLKFSDPCHSAKSVSSYVHQMELSANWEVVIKSFTKNTSIQLS